MNNVEFTRMLSDLLVAVLMICVPFIAKTGNKYLHNMIDQIQSEIEDQKLIEILRNINDSVATAVTATNQVYVDSIKNSGQPFSKEAQEEAFKKAYNIAFSMLTNDAKIYIAKAFDSIENYLTVKIEAEVKNQKSGVVTLTAIE